MKVHKVVMLVLVLAIAIALLGCGESLDLNQVGLLARGASHRSGRAYVVAVFAVLIGLLNLGLVVYILIKIGLGKRLLEDAKGCFKRAKGGLGAQKLPQAEKRPSAETPKPEKKAPELSSFDLRVLEILKLKDANSSDTALLFQQIKEELEHGGMDAEGFYHVRDHRYSEEALKRELQKSLKKLREGLVGFERYRGYWLL